MNEKHIDRRKPMEGLADFLRDVASNPDTATRHVDSLRRWADEVEASAAPLAGPELRRMVTRARRIVTVLEANETVPTDNVIANMRDMADALSYGNCSYWCPACYAAVAAPLAVGGVPPTHVIVPREPTPEMLKAWHTARPASAVQDADGSWSAPTPDWDAARYAAMIAATPLQAPQADKGPTDTEMLDWLETAYTTGGFKPKPWRDFMTQVAHLGYRAAISEAMKDHQP